MSCHWDENNSSTDVPNNNTEETTRIPEITTEELQTAINKLKKGKSRDSNGIRAEDIKACDDETREMMRQIFKEVIKRNEFTPEDWKKVMIKVIHKKGDVENVSNYRPICLLPALYKLFSTIFCTEDFTQRSIRNKPDNRLHEGVRLHHPQINLGRPQILRYRT